jgi:hypothetical protein
MSVLSLTNSWVKCPSISTNSKTVWNISPIGSHRKVIGIIPYDSDYKIDDWLGLNNTPPLHDLNSFFTKKWINQVKLMKITPIYLRSVHLTCSMFRRLHTLFLNWHNFWN